MSDSSADPSDLLAAARAGDRRALGRLLTQVESGSAPGREALRRLGPHDPRAALVGVTGPPGAGKSSLVSALVGAIRASGRTVAVLAVDPSSPVTGGAILGDRVRMQEHARDPGVFIRSMASRGAAGGLARATRDAATLLAHVGFDVVLVETVGAGQGEVAVTDLVDTTIVVEAPGMGDEVQALKAGLMEVADVVVVSKADLPGADRAAAALRAMLTVGAQHDRVMDGRPRPKRPEVLLVSSVTGAGVIDLLAAIDRRTTVVDGRMSGGDRSIVAPRSIALRPLRAEDDRVLYGIFRTAVDELAQRHRRDGWSFDLADDEEWERWRPLYEHIRATADEAWGAELDGRLVGYARSIRRADVRELTELFVLPEAQGQGLGTRLLEHALPPGTCRRSVLATTDGAALSRYLRLGLAPTAAVHRFEGAPTDDQPQLPDGVTVRRLADMPPESRRDALAAIDVVVLGMRRDVDHTWFGEHRTGWLLERAGDPVGYAYAGERQGPIAVLDPPLMRCAIGLVEAETRGRGLASGTLWVPLACTVAVRHLLERGYRIDPDPAYLLEDPAMVAVDRYVVMSPPFHL